MNTYIKITPKLNLTIIIHLDVFIFISFHLRQTEVPDGSRKQYTSNRRDDMNCDEGSYTLSDTSLPWQESKEFNKLLLRRSLIRLDTHISNY